MISVWHIIVASHNLEDIVAAAVAVPVVFFVLKDVLTSIQHLLIRTFVLVKAKETNFTTQSNLSDVDAYSQTKSSVYAGARTAVAAALLLALHE